MGLAGTPGIATARRGIGRSGGEFDKTVVLVPGARLGPYEILELLSRGGMGEVHRALDTKLRRDVAIKVLPASFANDVDRLHRFEREAQLLASLSHPHIGAIYGMEQSQDCVGLILELIG